MSKRDDNNKFNTKLIEIVKLNPWLYDNSTVDVTDGTKKNVWDKIDETLKWKKIYVKGKCSYLLILIIVFAPLYLFTCGIFQLNILFI